MICNKFRLAEGILHNRSCPERLLVVGAMLLLVAGCASAPADKPVTTESSKYADLYDSKMAATHATELPVATAEEARMRGDQALRNGDMDLALYLFIQALQLDENDATTLTKIGAIHASRDNLNLAEIAYWQALRINPDNATALTELGLIMLKKRQYPQARDKLTHSLNVTNQQWRAHNALGIVADMEGNHTEAALHYREALKIRPESPMLLNNLGYSLYLSEDRAGALKVIRQALDNDPNYKLAWQNLGLLYARERNYTAAVDAFSHAMELYKAYNDVGYLAMLDGNYQLSEDYLVKAIKLCPSYYEAAHSNLARARNLSASSNVSDNGGGLVESVKIHDMGN